MPPWELLLPPPPPLRLDRRVLEHRGGVNDTPENCVNDKTDRVVGVNQT